MAFCSTEKLNKPRQPFLIYINKVYRRVIPPYPFNSCPVSPYIVLRPQILHPAHLFLHVIHKENTLSSCVIYLLRAEGAVLNTVIPFCSYSLSKFKSLLVLLLGILSPLRYKIHLQILFVPDTIIVNVKIQTTVAARQLLRPQPDSGFLFI